MFSKPINYDKNKGFIDDLLMNYCYFSYILRNKGEKPFLWDIIVVKQGVFPEFI